jgi:NTP pyrophosphatase (non-canonical NTP hydrolase)
MNDKQTTINVLKEKIEAFVKSRKWDGENAKDVVMALSIEAAELMEIFAWLHSDEADNVKNNPKEFEHLREEIADVLIYLIRLCQHFDIDLSAAVEDKMEKNAIKYPVNYRDLLINE